MPMSKMAAGSFGAIYALVGIVGFLPILGGSYALDAHNLLGLFSVNAIHNAVHIGVGAAGLVAYSQGVRASWFFARGVGTIYAALAAIGLVAGSGNFLGLVPIGGLDIVLHAVTASVLLYVGFAGERRMAPAAA